MSNITKDFNGLPIVFREDGYINMTKAAKNFPGKRLDNFWASPDTRIYVEALDEYLKSLNSSELIQSKKGRYGGTFCHPKLAVFFARWLDVRFAVWCDLMIDNILQGNIQTTVVVPTVEAVAVHEVAERLKLENLQLKEEVQRLQEQGFQGDLPSGWATCGVFLEDKGVSFKGIKAYAQDLGALASTEMARRGMAAATLKSRTGTIDKDKTYYPLDALEVAYKKLKDQQMDIFAGMLP